MDQSASHICGNSLRSHEGKGTVGCLFSILMIGIAVFVLIQAFPPYYAFKNFETDAKTEISRAGANFFDDETLIHNLLDLARKNEIRLKREQIKVERFAGQVNIRITYTVPLDLIVYQRSMDFEVKASSFIGRL